MFAVPVKLNGPSIETNLPSIVRVPLNVVSPIYSRLLPDATVMLSLILLACSNALAVPAVNTCDCVTHSTSVPPEFSAKTFDPFPE